MSGHLSRSMMIRHWSGDHDERPNLEDCPACRRLYDELAAYHRPSRAERSAAAAMLRFDDEGTVTHGEDPEC